MPAAIASSVHARNKATVSASSPRHLPAPPPGQVFDLDHVSRHQSVVTLAEHRAAGWDGVVDAVAHFGDKFLPQVGVREGRVY